MRKLTLETKVSDKERLKIYKKALSMLNKSENPLHLCGLIPSIYMQISLYEFWDQIEFMHDSTILVFPELRNKIFRIKERNDNKERIKILEEIISEMQS